MSVPVYPAYKDSGVEWLGEVPAHWDLRRLGAYFVERREKVSDVDFPALSVTKNGIVPQLETAAKTDDGDNRKGVRAGDFVINSRSDRKGSSGLAPMDGSVSLINTVLLPGPDAHGPFVHHLLRSVAFQEEFYRYGKGIVADLWSTNYSEMRNILLAMPPLEEQAAIAAFLDRETGKIDALVEEQRRLIALVKEKRQAVISHAVTKGLNPQAPLKPSGIEWLGDIPAHWEVKPLRALIARIEAGTSVNAVDKPAEGDEIGVLKTSCVYDGTFRADENKAIIPEEEDRASCPVKVGCLIVSRMNTPDLVGASGLVREPAPGLFLPDRLWQVHLENVEPEFLYRWTGSVEYRAQVKIACGGTSSSMQNLSQDGFLSFRLAVPPRPEQAAIAAFLDGETGKIDALVGEAERGITLLQERRAALISAAVTGRIDLRGLVATPGALEAA